MATRLERLMFAIGMRDEASGKMGKLRKSITQTTDTVHEQFLRVGTGAAGAAALGVSVYQMVAPAIDLNRAMGEVASLDVDASAMAGLQASAKQFAMDYGGSAADVVRASYDIQSAIAGLKGNELGAFTVASGVLAKATKADVGVITNYMGTMYGIFKNQADRMGKAAWVEQLSGQTALAVQMFKTKGEEMSAAFTSLGANATAAGIAASEQIAILGTLQSTMSGSEAGTKYKAFLAGVGTAQKSLGLKFTGQDGKMLGMVEILDKIKGKFGETLDVAESDALKKAFGSDEAVSLIKQLMADSRGLAGSIDAIGQVQGMDKARQMAAKMTDIWHKGAGVLGVLAASFGQQLLPPIEALVGRGVEVAKTLVRWIDLAPNVARWVGYGAIAVMSLAAAMGVMAASMAVGRIAMLAVGGPVRLVISAIGLLTKLTGLQTAAQWLLNTAFWANPVFWVALGFVALVAVLAYAITHFDKLKAAFLDTSWGQAIMGVIDSIIAPFRALGDAWDWLSEKFGLGGGKAEITAKAVTAAQVATMPEAPETLPSISAPRVSEVPTGGVLRSSSAVLNQGNSRQTNIGSVTINSDKPMSPGELDEWALMGAG